MQPVASFLRHFNLELVTSILLFPSDGAAWTSASFLSYAFIGVRSRLPGGVSSPTTDSPAGRPVLAGHDEWPDGDAVFDVSFEVPEPAEGSLMRCARMYRLECEGYRTVEETRAEVTQAKMEKRATPAWRLFCTCETT